MDFLKIFKKAQNATTLFYRSLMCQILKNDVSEKCITLIQFEF